MKPTERRISYECGRYVLAATNEQAIFPLHAGDTIELFDRGCFRPVRLLRGEYQGWYYKASDGHRARLALCMRVRAVNGASLCASNTQASSC